jgi:Protein of unknown function (DUF3107)
VEVRIGVQQAARELVLESSESAEDITARIAKAVKDGGLIDLVDEKGHRVVLPAGKLAYIEIAAAEPRRVGFGSG